MMKRFLLTGSLLCWALISTTAVAGDHKPEGSGKQHACKNGCTTCKEAKKTSKKAAAKGTCPTGKCNKTSCPATKKAAASEHAVSTEEVAEMLKEDKDLLVFHARGAKHDDGKRIGNAVLLPAGSDKETILKAVGENKDAKILTYCANLKCPAGGNLAAKLRKYGYKNVVEYPAGIAGWKEAGNEVTEAKE